MMRPKPRARMPSISGRHMLNCELRLVLITAVHCSIDILWNIVSRVIPALFTRMSIGPTSLSICLTASPQAPKSATSHFLASMPVSLLNARAASSLAA